eukprot:8089152-Alexandrium_andersonii.AAC.1
MHALRKLSPSQRNTLRAVGSSAMWTPRHSLHAVTWLGNVPPLPLPVNARFKRMAVSYILTLRIGPGLARSYQAKCLRCCPGQAKEAFWTLLHLTMMSLASSG